MSKNCILCGVELNENDVICSNCGVNQTDETKVGTLLNKRHNVTKKLIACIIGFIVIVVIIGTSLYNVNDFNKLPSVSTLEKELNNAFGSFFNAFDIDFNKVENFAVENVENEDTHDQSFSCNVMGDFHNIIGQAKDGKVVQLQHIFMLDSDMITSQEMANTIITILLVPPLSIFDDDVQPSTDKVDFLLDFEYLSSDSNETIDKYIKIDGNLEYTAMLGGNDDISILSFNVRYLPAYDGVGIFDE